MTILNSWNWPIYEVNSDAISREDAHHLLCIGDITYANSASGDSSIVRIDNND
jgi:hypothetical protein